MKRLGWAVVAVVMACAEVAAQGRGLLGNWRQTSSDAGDCDSCRITISQSGRGFELVANNGWSAFLSGDSERAIGRGRWGQDGGAYANRAMTIEVAQLGGTLAMSMTIDGTGTVVRATYAR